MGQLPNVQNLQIKNCTFYEKLKSTIFTQLNLKLRIKLSELRLVDVSIDHANISGVI